MKYQVSVLSVVILIGLAVFVPAEKGERNAPTLSPDEVVQLLKERAKPFDNFKIDLALSGRNVIPPRLWARERFGITMEPHPEVEIKYEARETLMTRGTQVTFEKEITSQKPSMEGFSISEKMKWSNAAGHIRELSSAGGEFIMSLDPLETATNKNIGTSRSDNVLLAMGVGIGRIIESIESIQHEPNGDITVKGTVSLSGFKSPCTMRLNKDYFPLHISIIVSRNMSLHETYDIHIDEVSTVNGHWYGKSGKLVIEELTIMPTAPFHRIRVFDDYAYEVSEIKLSVSDDEHEKFASMPITSGMHVMNRLPKPNSHPLPDLPIRNSLLPVGTLE